MDTPVLDWRPRHDERSLAYSATQLLTSAARRTRHWQVGPTLDQGGEGHCVGYAWTAEALAEPIAVQLDRLKEHTPTDPTKFARYLYAIATHLDQWEGEDDEGTSVLAGAKAAQNLGVLRSYHWAFTLPTLLDAVVQRGPAVLGIPWFSGMYSAPNGVLKVSGNLVGGHAIPVVGYTAASDRLGGAETVTLQNSWGTKWGINGLAEIRTAELWELLSQRGEACIPTSRSFGRS